jgi:hypothetical protein
MENTISLKDIADLLIKASERVDFYWNFLAVILIALVGWLIALKNPLTREMKVLVTVTYLLAAGMNLLGLYSSYTFAEALRLDLLSLPGSEVLRASREVLDAHSFAAQRLMACWVHGIIAASVLGVLWLGRFGSRRIPASRP